MSAAVQGEGWCMQQRPVAGLNVSGRIRHATARGAVSGRSVGQRVSTQNEKHAEMDAPNPNPNPMMRGSRIWAGGVFTVVLLMKISQLRRKPHGRGCR